MISRLEHLPRWTTLWLRSDTLDRKQGQMTVQLRGYVAGLPVESTVRAMLQPSRAVEWRQTHGTLLHYAARFDFQGLEEGTLVTYTVQMEPGIMLLSEAATRLVAVQEVERTLARLKLSAERDIVAEEIRLMKARPPATAPASSEAVSAAAETAPEGGVADTAQEGDVASQSAPEEGTAPGKKRRRRRRRRPRS
jgi:hypothetical protein